MKTYFSQIGVAWDSNHGMIYSLETGLPIDPLTYEGEDARDTMTAWARCYDQHFSQHFNHEAAKQCVEDTFRISLKGKRSQ